MSIESSEPNIETTTLADAGGVNLASVSAGGALKIDGSAVTQPVSGTVTVGNATLAVTESGTWNITNISGTVSLPTGAATSVLQTTANTTLAAIDAGIPTALGQTTMAASMPVVISSNQSAIPVAGTFFQTTQPVSGTVTANAGTGNFTVTQSTGANLHTVIDSGSITANIGTSGSLALDATLTGGTAKTRILDNNGIAITSTSVNGRQAIDTRKADVSLLAVTATGTAGTAVTLTLPAVALVFHYITSIEIVKYATAAITGSATPVVVTTTNLPGNIAFTFGTAQAIGTTLIENYIGIDALRSLVVNTATTIVCPATTNVIWRCNAFYYTTG